MSEILALKKLRQEDQKFKAVLDFTHSILMVSLGYRKSYLKTNKNNNGSTKRKVCNTEEMK